ncbi:MAG: MBL fold metallo-hydrolase [Oscillospiraceae bacterium]|nr:MBL fold metallo-hydrolase [Oscillospiraceae bacterium]
MSSLNRLGENTYYIDGVTNIGVYRRGENCFLIDAGLNSSAAETILGILQENGLKLEKVFLTHSHADHSGGCAYLKERTGCGIFAPGVCAQLVRYPFLIPTTLYGGYPNIKMRSPFIMPAACECAEISESDLPEGLGFTHIDGHDFEQIAFRTDDGVWFIGDAVSDKTTLGRYKISFLHNIKAHLNSLELLKTVDGKIFIPSHSAPVNEIKTLCEENIANVREVSQIIKRLCEDGITIDELIERLLDEFDIRLYIMQYELVGETARSYLSYLAEQKEIEYVFDKNKLMWKTAKSS